MPHGRTSCRGKGSALLRIELERLYAERSAVNAAIRELELWQRALAVPAETSPPAPGLEFSAKPCNLTGCRSA